MLTYVLPATLPSEYKVQVFDLRTILPTNPKYTWESLKGLRDVTELTTIVLHHDAILKSASAKMSDVEFAKSIAANHIKLTKNRPDGDAGFPYHVWIRNGTIYTCNNLEAFTFGVASNNSYTVHICVSGRYDKGYDELTDRDRTALYAAIMMVKSVLPRFAGIKGHGEIMPTACPGYDMKRVRSDITNIELTMQHEGTPEDKLADIFKTITRLNQLYATASKPGQYQQAAIDKLQPIVNAARETELIK